MKNKKNLIIIIEGIIIAVLAIAMIIMCLSKKENKNVPSDKEQSISFKESSKELPNFSIQLTGGYEGFITKEYVEEENIKLYEFDATVNNGWNRNTDRYIGYKLNDILNAFDISDYSSIEFNSSDGVRINFGRYLITDNFFIVFYQNGELIDETTPAMLLTTEYRSNYSVGRLLTMDVRLPAKPGEEPPAPEGDTDNEQQ